jgi:hypothetical protein
MMFFVVCTTQCPNSPLLLHPLFRLLYQPLCWVFWLYDLIAIAIGISIAINIIITIFVTTLTTAIAVIRLYLPTAFYLLLLSVFVFAFVKVLFTSPSASLAQVQNSV